MAWLSDHAWPNSTGRMLRGHFCRPSLGGPSHSAPRQSLQQQNTAASFLISKAMAEILPTATSKLLDNSCGLPTVSYRSPSNHSVVRSRGNMLNLNYPIFTSASHFGIHQHFGFIATSNSQNGLSRHPIGYGKV